MGADSAYIKKARRKLHKNAMSYIEQILKAHLMKKLQYGYLPPKPSQ